MCVPRCQHVYQGVNMCTKVSTCAPRCQHVHQGIDMCTKVSTCAPRCQHVYQGVNMCTRVSTCVPRCQSMCAPRCQHVYQGVNMCTMYFCVEYDMSNRKHGCVGPRKPADHHMNIVEPNGSTSITSAVEPNQSTDHEYHYTINPVPQFNSAM